MTWYLVVRALCIFAFVMGATSLIVAGIYAGDGVPRRAWPFLGVSVLLGLVGCLLVGVGWGPEHP
ncbi:hypothetical protein SEA_SPECKS_197 [Mycobacterium phage Specks]|uniref:Uncharacterized protein n=1 Tax=Mycobacterium phage Dandelion TaxID=1074305 RepID=G1JVM9_9CAUD|nr:hypothetical protein DANDELION_200 [Mycobacterium phage Dandelion]AEL97836.1 hypothetical protein DANDELION_200 [Mycobacterium phage Dandelion]QAY04547.1 hypothetical protein SEA_TEARDROP_190 [Mycobacterium phage Teardrop]QAY12345.1 hypothetical protein SEA_FOXTROTP1_191 [Mycobacterium phage FoxtrotP1]QAY26624.1 hypothetical protein SEA_SPECKS_197 [Mycobacterium phage Specks]